MMGQIRVKLSNARKLCSQGSDDNDDNGILANTQNIGGKCSMRRKKQYFFSLEYRNTMH